MRAASGLGSGADPVAPPAGLHREVHLSRTESGLRWVRLEHPREAHRPGEAAPRICEGSGGAAAAAPS